VPRSARNEIIGPHGGALRVRVSAPPVRGAANAALVGLLADALGVPKSFVEIESGGSSRLKTLRVYGIQREEAVERLQRAASAMST
jgi:uncharacterized protein (TIGR00251 family)